MDFYVLEPDGEMFGTKWAYGETILPTNYGEAPYCPVCSRRPIGVRKWLEPRRVHLSSSKPTKWGDVVWGAGFTLIVSDKFKRSYFHYELTGIEEFLPSLEIIRVGNKRADRFDKLPLYYPVVIELLGANVNDDESNVVRKPQACHYCRGDVLSIDRVVIQKSSWRGSDIFEARGLYGVTLVTERFKEMVEKEDLANVHLVPAAEFNYDYRFGENTQP